MSQRRSNNFEKLSTSLNAWLAPELARVSDKRVRKRMERRVMCSRRYYCVLLPLLTGISFLLPFFMMAIIPSLLLNASPRFLPIVLRLLSIWVIAFTFAAIAVILVTPVMRKEVRKELNGCGFPTCVRCGYDMRGCAGGECPECGTPAVPVVATRGDMTYPSITMPIVLTIASILLGVVPGAITAWKLAVYVGWVNVPVT